MKHDDDNPEEESFFVSMTDIMVGLLFIFIMIIMYFALQAKMDSQEIKKLQNENRVLLGIIGENTGKDYSDLTAYQSQITVQRGNILNWIRDHLKISGIQGVEIIEEQGVIRLPEGILFDSGAFQFDTGSKAEGTARAIARAMRAVLPCSVLTSEGRPYKSRKECSRATYHNKSAAFIQSIYVEGHTDSIQIRGSLRGDPQLTTNLKLSARRATNTFETMTDEEANLISFHGPVLDESALRFEPVLASAAYGEWRPIASNESEVGRRANRRIDLRINMYVPPNIEAMKELAKLVGEVAKVGK